MLAHIFSYAKISFVRDYFCILQGDEISLDKGHDSDKIDAGSSAKTTPIKIGASAAQTKSSPQTGSRETSCMLSDVLSDQDIDWKLDVEDIKSRDTFKILERIKR
jgi:hypothetical protein